ncbi:MAG: 2,3-bisphosphoglycerate-independent phosphoglycerate mutase [Acidimicrobiia bacterium]
MEISSLAVPATSKIVLVVMDGLGGYADLHRGSELEEAATPNLDSLAAKGVTGLLEPVGPGITPGSGPGHLGLFGYDPRSVELGRGALSAAGLEFDLLPGDVAARGNLATLAADGSVSDRRAGRISDEASAAIVARLGAAVHLEGVSVHFRHEREHRLLVVLRGEGLDRRVTDTDPQTIGSPPLAPLPVHPSAERTAALVADLDAQVRRLLQAEPKANAILFRGFDSVRALARFPDCYRLRAAAVAVYPMYRGIARLLGMDVLGRPGGLDDQLELLAGAWKDYDYFFFHHKPTDSAGEDGDRPRKIAAIERLDAALPRILALAPDVIAVTGDHATPTQMAAHSWHPVPVVLWGEHCGIDDVTCFGERACMRGGLGRRQARHLMALLMANAGRLAKYGA